MTEHLDDAVSKAESLYERLLDTQEADAELRVTEDEIEERLSKIEGAVKMHNDALAEKETGE